MQDLLSAKTTIAAQSDRLLSHYRSQIAQYEAEVMTSFCYACVEDNREDYRTTITVKYAHS